MCGCTKSPVTILHTSGTRPFQSRGTLRPQHWRVWSSLTCLWCIVCTNGLDLSPSETLAFLNLPCLQSKKHTILVMPSWNLMTVIIHNDTYTHVLSWLYTMIHTHMLGACNCMHCLCYLFYTMQSTFACLWRLVLWKHDKCQIII